MLEPSRLLGTWKIACSSYAFWRPMLRHVRTDAEVTYASLGPGRWSDVLRYRAASWLAPNGAKRWRQIVGVDAVIAPGTFAWRGVGVLSAMRNAWRVVAFDPSYAWMVTYVAPSVFGAAAIDVYVRTIDPSLDTDAILDATCTTPVLRDAAIGMRALPHGA